MVVVVVVVVAVALCLPLFLFHLQIQKGDHVMGEMVCQAICSQWQGEVGNGHGA